MSRQTHSRPPRKPVGHAGPNRDQRAARLEANGWFGVLAVLVCVGVCIPLASSSVPGFMAIPIVAGDPDRAPRS